MTLPEVLRGLPPFAHIPDARLALLAADAFWAFGEAEDKNTALGMFSEVGSRFPQSSLVKDLAPHVKRLNAAKPTPASRTPPKAADASVAPNHCAAVRRETAATGIAASPTDWS